MSLLSNFFVADPSDIQSMDLSIDPNDLFPTVSGKHVDVVKLVRLQCIIDGSNFSDHLAGLGELFLREDSEDGPWVLNVPSPIVDKLAKAEKRDTREIAIQWAETEEWKADGGTSENILPFLMAVSNLAIRANSEGKKLFLWVSL